MGIFFIEFHWGSHENNKQFKNKRVQILGQNFTFVPWISVRKKIRNHKSKERKNKIKTQSK